MRTFVGLLAVIVMASFVALTYKIYEINERIKLLNSDLDVYETAISASREEAIEEAMKHAPKGKSIYQLRGDAQKAAQDSLDRLTKLHNLPRYELPAIRFHLATQNNIAAAVPPCTDDNGNTVTNFFIQANEILFLHNYEEYLYMWIPHEVSHIFACLNGGGYSLDITPETRWEIEHGQEWEQAMKDLGFVDPEQYKTHEMDMTPVYDYKRSLVKRLRDALGEVK
jgi:hypothetical protein